jgi:O-antigen ligase
LDLGTALHGNYSDGSPLDAAFFALLIVIGGILLIRRGVVSSDLLRQNLWLVLLILFGLISVLWSEFPAIAMKRWIKSLGHPIMALIILTDPLPRQALGIVMKRSAIFLLPASILFIKFLPQYGRGFDFWTGAGYYNGVMHTKNDLGYVCMVLAIFFVWNLICRDKYLEKSTRREESAVSIMFLLMIAWLLGIADSATSSATTAIGLGVLILLGTPLVSKRHFFLYTVTVVVVLAGVEAQFGVYENVVTMLGRDPSLTDRTTVWADAIALQSRPIIGMGFESFWLGSRLDWMSAKWWWQPNQAHNGYIEIYLNLGFIGLFLFIALIISTLRKAAAGLTSESNFEFSRLRLALLFAILSHNYTEATFKGVHLLWTMLHLVVINIPERETIRERIGAAQKGASNPKGNLPASQFRKVG